MRLEMCLLAGTSEGDQTDSHHKAPESVGRGLDCQGAVVGSGSHVRLDTQTGQRFESTWKRTPVCGLLCLTAAGRERPSTHASVWKSTPATLQLVKMEDLFQPAIHTPGADGPATCLLPAPLSADRMTMLKKRI